MFAIKNRNFLDVFAKHPGSMHDAKKLNKIDLWIAVSSKEIVVPEKCYFFADCLSFVVLNFAALSG